MMPHLGAGAGQGLEDALLLARLLSNPSVRKDTVKVSQWHVSNLTTSHNLYRPSCKHTLKCDVQGHRQSGSSATARDAYMNTMERTNLRRKE